MDGFHRARPNVLYVDLPQAESGAIPIKAINAPNRNTIQSYLFTLSDTRDARGGDAEAYAFLNNRDREVGGDVVEALHAYEVKAALWSHRGEYASALVN